MKNALSGICFLVVLALAPARSWGAPIKVDVGPDSIQCNSVILGSIAFKPDYVSGGSATETTVKVKGSLAGCTVSGPNPATILSGTFKGTLAGTTNNAFLVFLFTEPLTGEIAVTWKADKSTPLLESKSTLTIATSTGSLRSESGVGNYQQLSFNTTAVTGAFTGGDGGISSSNLFVSSEDANAINAENASGGIKLLHFGIGTLHLG